MERVNRNLKHLGKLCGINTTLTTCVARHTWATLAKVMGTPSAGIGHTTEKTTRIYLKDFDHNIAHNAKKQVSDI